MPLMVNPSPQRPDNELGSTLVLVRNAQQGRRAALEQLFERFAPKVRLIAALRFGWSLKAFDDFEDITQEALLRAFRGLEGFAVERSGQAIGAFRNWLACCVQTAIADQLKRHGAAKRGDGRILRFGELRRESYTSSVLGGPGREPTPSQSLEAKELAARIETALLELKQTQREVFVLRRLCGMEYEEIARKLAYQSKGAVRLVVHHVQRSVEKRLEG
jgi:RNA polymerase sigma factor (sigma-70 family)